MRGISLLIKPASSMCNMVCKYCFYKDESQYRQKQNCGMMKLDTLKNVIRKTLLNAEDFVSIVFQGGEPTIRGITFFREVIRLEKHYNRRNIVIQNALQTNGYLINAEWCRFLHENHFLVGLSVDGIQQIHDYYRRDSHGNGTYEQVCQAAKLFDEYAVEYNILTVVTEDIAENINEVYRSYKEKNWRYLQFIPCLEPLEANCGTMSYALTPEIYGEFLKNLFDLWYQDFKQGDYTSIRQFENYIQICMGMLPEACDQGGICSIQHVVEADGTVYPCDFYVMDEYCLGNYNDDFFIDFQ